MYGKIFESIYDGTLAGDWRALITFQQFIILSDADGFIDMTPEAIARRTGIPIEHIIAGIEILEKTDRYSRTPDEEGRRIELIDGHRTWGWHIVNHEKYKKIQDSDTIRAQTRERVRKHRESKKNKILPSVTVTEGNGSNAKKRYKDKDINKQKKVQNFILPDWIDGEIWKSFVEHRQKLKAPMTDKAKNLIIGKLEKQQHNANQILNQSIESGWKGVFDLKEDKKPQFKNTINTSIMTLGKQKNILPRAGESMEAYEQRVRQSR